MGSSSVQIKHLIHITIIFLPYILCVVYCQVPQISASVLPPLPLIPEILPPLPLIPGLLNFLDQRLAIIYPIIQTFKNTITLDPFNITQTWVGSDICNYKGFYCDNPPDNFSAITVASIDFNGFQLAAPTLDGFIDQIPELAIFHANSNSFSGCIPSKIANLTYLYELDLSNNKLSGNFPIEILGMSSLSFLDIRYNSFTGSVPPQIFMQTLDVLFLNNNNFLQKLPDNIGNTRVLYLTLANNKFTGPIPQSIGNASSTLTEVLLLNNLLTGCLPYELGFLREIRVFDAGNNLLTGPLPCSLGCLEKIEQLNFAGNLFYGQVPEVLCTLGNLVNLSLSNNYFTKAGPSCRKLINNGVLDVRKNCIHDLPDQRSAKECAGFFLHPRVCPNPSSFNITPCSVNPRKNPRAESKRNSVTYNALSRHRL